jgi:hypothetical protein
MSVIGKLPITHYPLPIICDRQGNQTNFVLDSTSCVQWAKQKPNSYSPISRSSQPSVEPTACRFELFGGIAQLLLLLFLSAVYSEG